MIRPARLPADRPAIIALLASVSEDTGYPALSEEPRLDLQEGPIRPGLIVEEAGVVVGYAHLLDRQGVVVVETAVDPGRRADLAAPLVGGVLEACGGTPLRLWAKDDETAAAACSRGLTEARIMLRLDSPLPPAARPNPVGEARIVPFRPGADEEAYLVVSNEAFAGHPDSGGWDRKTLAERMSRPWFDPAGVFLAWERGRPIGICWTKLHSGGLGEIYSVAVRPDKSGGGLGRALTLTGLWHLSERRGATHGMLYAQADNHPALALYRSLGFEATREVRELVSNA